MTFTKILCPTDFSDGSRRALELASRLAIRSRAELVIAHAWQLPVYSGGYVVAPDVMQRMSDDAKAALAESVRIATELGAPNVSSRYVAGLPWRAIVDLVAEDPAIDLVVLGTHGRTGIRRVLLGSIAERVVRLSPSAVLAVHPDDHPSTFGHVLCPTDFSESAEHALRIAAQLVDTKVADARIDLVHVVEVPYAPDRISHMVAVSRELEDRAKVELEHRIAAVTAPCPIIARTEAGHIGEQLVTMVESEPYDLVVVGSHGRTGMKRVLLGSIAEKLVRHAKCPVLVAREREPA